MEDAYVMGHRLVAFLGSALPRHPAYVTSTPQRAITERHLHWIQDQMQQIAILIDEEQLNRYITNDFDPVIEEDDEDEEHQYCDHLCDEGELTEWEAFAGWSLHYDIPPGGVDTDESSQDIDSDIDFIVLDPQKRAVTSDIIATKTSTADPELHNISLSDDEDYDTDEENDDMTNPFVIKMKPPVLSSSILRKIAREAVRYESDSEAADSWAQDGTCGASDTTSSEVGGCGNTNGNPDVGAGVLQYTSCDPARLAFRAIMNKHSRQLQSLQLEMDRLLSDDTSSPQQTNYRDTTSSIRQQSSEEEKSQDEYEEDLPSANDKDDDSVLISEMIPLPIPAISGPQLMDPQFILTETTMAAARTDIAPPRNETPSPSNPISPTPSNSPEDADLHRTNRWGVQLRRTPLPPTTSIIQRAYKF
jgi:hypothetical protein